MRKNPYLFKAKNITKASELVSGIVDAYLSSQEESIFREFLERLAIYVSEIEYRGVKSSAEGIDLEFLEQGIRYLVSIKSGPNWGNSSQIRKMEDNFKKAKKILLSNSRNIPVVAINGCCYGKEKVQNKGSYLKLCGQDFWEFLTKDADFYLKIIEPLGYRAKQKNDEFIKEYDKVINLFTREFIEDFCTDGAIDWEKLVRFNSGRITASSL